MATSYYKSKYDRQFTPGQGLPTISTELDSVRAYQFEIHFIGLPDDVTNSTDLTLAATKVTGIEMGNEAIVVNRVNDKVHYPGRNTPGDMVVTFDNLYLRETASDLWRYFKNTYDPITGEMTKNSQPGGGAGKTFKADKVEIVMLDNTMTPHSTVEVYGVYPSKWSAAEFNYSTNDFHKLDVTFKYDFMNSYNYANPG
tara:strand:+ start:7967 stop:8560 length:594 start_codon:yes stop_codon:yes gene_type:complete